MLNSVESTFPLVITGFGLHAVADVKLGQSCYVLERVLDHVLGLVLEHVNMLVTAL